MAGAPPEAEAVAVPLPNSSCRLVVIGALPEAFATWLEEDHFPSRGRRGALLALIGRAAAALPEDAVGEASEIAVGARVPIVHRWLRPVASSTSSDYDVALSVHDAYVVAPTDDLVVVALSSEESMVDWRVGTPSSEEPWPEDDTAAAPQRRRAVDAVAEFLVAKTANVAPDGVNHHEIVGRCAHFLAESFTRAALEAVVRRDLPALDQVGVRIIGARPGRPEARELEVRLAAARFVPRQVQRVRAALGAAVEPVEAAVREHLGLWQFGHDGFHDIDVARHGALEGHLPSLSRAHAHLSAAAEASRRGRREALETLSTQQHLLQNLEREGSEEARATAQQFQENVAVLTAALAGPGLLFALWALEVDARPVAHLLAAGDIALALLLAVWRYLRRKSGHARLDRADYGLGALLVVMLVAFGLVLPSRQAPRTDESRARDAIEDVRRLLAEERVLARRDRALLRRELASLRRTLARERDR